MLIVESLNLVSYEVYKEIALHTFVRDANFPIWENLHGCAVSPIHVEGAVFVEGIS